MTSQKKARSLYKITIICRHAGMDKLTTAENVGTSFKCPLCNETVIYLPKEQRIGAHGQPNPGNDKKAAVKPKHELRKVSELSS